ncbi:MAG TPA: hypothetical protein VFG50_17730 [Rhodothermales bacterium]|nr:hypothetical protein [Rhodothermales bacterium]
MPFSFSDDDIERISSVLGVAPKRDGSLYRYELEHEESGRRVALEIQVHVNVPEALANQPANLVSVYATASFLQLQNCTGYIASQELGEVIFFAKQGGVTNGLVVEREAGSSLYANVSDKLLSTDFTQLPPELIMSSVALSMTESIFNDLG